MEPFSHLFTPIRFYVKEIKKDAAADAASDDDDDDDDEEEEEEEEEEDDDDDDDNDDDGDDVEFKLVCTYFKRSGILIDYKEN